MSAVVPFYIKTAYHDEPSFADTKVITSLFSNSLVKGLGENFKECVEFRDAKAELLKPYKDSFDFDELSKLAIDYSDGVIQADNGVEASLLKYANEKKVPLLGYQEDFGDAYEAFYDKICPDPE
jgi:starch synthase